MLHKYLEIIEKNLASGHKQIAVNLKTEKTTYAQFYERYLFFLEMINRKTGPDEVVAIKMNKSPSFYAAIFAALKAERPFLPLPLQAPAEREKQILKESQPRLWITEAECFVFDQPKSYPGLAYIMYTSGSTGQPKGVCITRDNLFGFFNNIDKQFDVEQGGRVSQCFDGHFDPFLADLFFCYKNQGTIFPISDNDYYSLFDFLSENEIQYFASVPSLVRMNLPRIDAAAKLTLLRRTLFTGEALETQVARSWMGCAPSAEIYNLYGPTECTVWTHAKKIAEVDLSGFTVPIGKCLEGLHCVVDQAGLLWIRGPQVAEGYLRDGAIVRQDDANGYCTGDRVQILANGDCLYLGRLDQQIKIGGQRFDLLEIESSIQKVSPGTQAIVVAETRGSSISCTCIITTDTKLDWRRITESLASYIPRPFVPQKVYGCAAFCINSSGKLDRGKMAQRASHGEFTNLLGVRS